MYAACSVLSFGVACLWVCVIIKESPSSSRTIVRSKMVGCAFFSSCFQPVCLYFLSITAEKMWIETYKQCLQARSTTAFVFWRILKRIKVKSKLRYFSSFDQFSLVRCIAHAIITFFRNMHFNNGQAFSSQRNSNLTAWCILYLCWWLGSMQTAWAGMGLELLNGTILLLCRTRKRNFRAYYEGFVDFDCPLEDSLVYYVSKSIYFHASPCNAKISHRL